MDLEPGVLEDPDRVSFRLAPHVGDVDHRRTRGQHDVDGAAALDQLAGSGILAEHLVGGGVALLVADLADRQPVGSEEQEQLVAG